MLVSAVDAAASRAPATSTTRPASPTSSCATGRCPSCRRDPYPVFAAPGAAPVFRRDVFERLGGYEERFFLYYEDVDLAFRAILAGYHALHGARRARVVHRLGATTRSHARARFYVARNSVWCAVRCLPETGPLRL